MGMREAIIDLNHHLQIFNCLCVTLWETFPESIIHAKLTATIYPKTSNRATAEIHFRLLLSVRCFVLLLLLIFFCVYGKLAFANVQREKSVVKIVELPFIFSFGILRQATKYAYSFGIFNKEKRYKRKYRQRRKEQEMPMERQTTNESNETDDSFVFPHSLPSMAAVILLLLCHVCSPHFGRFEMMPLLNCIQIIPAEHSLQESALALWTVSMNNKLGSFSASKESTNKKENYGHRDRETSIAFVVLIILD